MPIAALKTSLADASVDAAQSILTGCRVFDLGHQATFAGEDDKPKSITITKEHIRAFRDAAGNRALPMHWTHDDYSEKDRLSTRVGLLKNLREDEHGNLIGDAWLAPGAERERALWFASNDPSNIMLSAVFAYKRSDPKCLPTDARAVDFVASGAGVTALFSEADPNPDTTMPPFDIQAIITALQDPVTGPALAAAIKAAIKEAEPDTTPAETEASVTDADKKPEDDALPALMRSSVRIHRATIRIAKCAAAPELSEAQLKQVEARLATKGVGTTRVLAQGSGATITAGNPLETAVLAHLSAMPDGKKSRGLAIARALRDNPEYEQYRNQI